MSDSQIVIIGALGQDPQLRFTNAGKALASLVVAVSHRYKKQDEWVEDTAWWDVTVWGELAENVAASCVKGSRVICTGRVKQEEWDDKDSGKKRTKLVLVADEVGASLRWATATIDRVERERT